MNAIGNSGVTELKRSSTLKLEEGSGTEVRVIAGNIWRTQYRDTSAYLMRAGDRVALNGKGTPLIYAFAASSLRFIVPESAQPSKVELRFRGEVTVAA